MDQQKNGVRSQGETITERPEDEKKALETLTVDAVKKMLKVDLGCCMLLLQTLNDDPTVFDMVATAIHGSYMNKKHKAELDAQLALDLVKANR